MKQSRTLRDRDGVSILIVDDEPLIRDTLAEYLTQEGFCVTSTASGEEALEHAGREHFDIAVCDFQLPGMNGLDLLRRLLQHGPDMCIFLMTAYGTVENAVEAFQRGAHDYLMKPILLDEVLAKIRRFLAHREVFLENQWLRRELHQTTRSQPTIIGESPGINQVKEIIRKVAPTRSTVLILGESGTGKELVARAIHDGGEGRFVAINCAAIPHDLLENQLFGHRKGAFTGADRDQVGVFEHAGRGTVFLDEVGEMPPAAQAKLLRAIEQKEILPVGANEPIRVEARILSAANRDLWKEVEAGRFREDLYYRLNVVGIRLPPLRERREDIPLLVEHLLARHVKEMGRRITGVSQEAMRLLMSCRWRGNIREIDNVLQRAVILSDGPLITLGDLPPDLAPQEDDPSVVDDLGEAVRRFEKRHIERILRQTADKKEAARRLNIGLSSLYRRLTDLDIPLSSSERPDEPDA
jgi:DNA-binding NtrC family response regulator